MELLKTAYVGTLGVSYGDFVFLEVTGRQEKSSTLPKDSRNYFYPSASVSFLYSEAFKDNLPSWYDYGKLRFAYGIVGNSPEAYAANMAYSVGSAPGWSYNQVPADLGNEKLKPEQTKEFEIGLENKFLNNRAGFEISYYSKDITDMLIKSSLAPSSGSSTIWLNSGSMTNKGIEFSVYGTIVETKDFTWELRGNAGFNRNEVTSLVEGINFIEIGGYAGSLGRVYSTVGRPMGDFVTNINQVVESGQYKGRSIVSESGNYVMTPTQEVVGNGNPDAIGGLGTSLSYKNLTFDINTDLRIGGYVVNEPYQYTMTLGVNPDTENREGEGFLNYTYSNGYTAKTGIILDGVISDGNGGWRENDVVIPYESYIQSKYNWGGAGNPNSTLSVYENSWWKVREVALTYNFPKDLIRSAALKNLSLSVYGRNLFYLFKKIPNYDPETSNSTDWKSQLAIGGSAAPTRTVGVSLRATF
jgi:outer membrane receptor protein involved in Fe transport